MKPSARLLLALAASIAASVAVAVGARDALPPLAERLSATGLDAPGVLAFTPQYPLWSDGATKRRWIHLPAGTAIDATLPDAWSFPPGTRLWKTFGHARPVETRLIERLPDGTWRFAAYVWEADGRDATLAPADGAVIAVAGAPGGRHVVPSRQDCLACHEGASTPVLGFSALQLSRDRDPGAPHAEAPQDSDIDLAHLVREGRVRGLPSAALDARIAASSPTERAALGYLHANCGHCHNATGPLASLDLHLAQGAADPRASAERTRASLLGQASRFRPHGHGDVARVATSAQGSSVVAVRMRSDNRLARMPPLGVQVIDEEGIALVERWIHDLQRPSETSR